ncbi:Predicted O-linked N-acetylglucosamine transferase, SPINDLY family [Duganella sp. CF517]|uniref:O-linked N-acetylglucosamine transferase family protein n=1 Tax=Duganella sp. CF517 TaxID=1881038 RepID=UPI0008D441D9|nr:glycosyltransferase [Duganella sp. CF517]SEO60345.1 Predicted O-linked N-acetylglucosamine transferase, SPINDLY family [Duganella sp. CF517]
MTRQLHAAMAAGNLAEAGTLALALAGLGELSVMDLIGVAGLLAAQGRTEQTIALYTLWLERCESPLEYVAWYNLAVLQAQGEDDAGAERAYRKSLKLRPGFTESQLGLGVLLERKRQPEAALALWREALDLLEALPPVAPAAAALQVRLLNNIGRLAEARGDPAQAEDALLRSLQLDPKQRLIVPRWLDLRLKLCAWPVHGFVPGVGETALRHHTSALAMLSLDDDPARQLACARREVAARLPSAPAALSGPDGYAHRKLRVGYLSGGFGAHPTGRQIAELLELHDRDQVEVYGFCCSAEDNSALRQRLLRAFDLHVPIGPLSDVQAAQAIRAHEIDILVDLHGRLPGGRPGILAHRPAPVQIGWLGAAGTSGDGCVDYVLADSFVLPPELAGQHSEKPLYLPQCFQPQDRQRALPPPPPAGARAQYRLADDAFVFCCFGAAEHIVPERFTTWMRILHAVPDSVLWLQTDSEQVRDNLRLAALQRGIPSDRLHFAGAGERQAARYQAADLFLDTGPHNAGAIAGDVLWAGLPLLTCAGRTFASRVCGSLLQAAGLPELIARTEKQYAARAIRLATHPKELARLRNRLAKNRTGAPLFDTPALARDLELLYLRVARGTLKRGRRKAAQQAADAAPPLVSILIPADDPLPLEATLASALAQTHANCEVIVSDSSPHGACRALLKPHLKAHRRLRYSHAPGLGALDNLNHCLALSLGAYIAVAPPGDTLAPEKIAVMLPCFVDHPHVGVVACWRQPLAPDGQPLPAAPLFAADIVVDGASLSNMLLGGDGGGAAAMCAPGALLLKRATLGDAFGRYRERPYRERANVATALTALQAGHYVYLPRALSTFRPAPSAPAAAAPTPAATLDSALEGLQLLHQAHQQGHDFGAPGAFKRLLSTRLSEMNTLISTHHLALASSAQHRLDAVQRAMRIGYQLLLTP